MKLAEALQERADLNRKIEQIKNRINNNVLVQEGEETAEDPAQLKQELDVCLERLTYLISHINLTNCQTVVGGNTLTELIAKRDVLIWKIRAYKDIINIGSQMTYRARGSEIKIKATISVKEWQKQVDQMAKEARLLDNTLQQSNWMTDLVE